MVQTFIKIFDLFVDIDWDVDIMSVHKVPGSVNQD